MWLKLKTNSSILTSVVILLFVLIYVTTGKYYSDLQIEQMIQHDQISLHRFIRGMHFGENWLKPIEMEGLLPFHTTYAADIFLAQRWKDHRLRLPENMTAEYRLLEVEFLQNMWRPDAFIKDCIYG
ncbi:unnamed protein product [Allacma fusca]|uniref:Uncharacterized protein n=1 Tax=Allacma fusca TaxID=39272 RepID=A0A8J2JMM0_9HEXA|nr:unnamed protein product [Allacma fusca]